MCREFAMSHSWDEVRRHFALENSARNATPFAPNFGWHAGERIPAIGITQSALTQSGSAQEESSTRSSQSGEVGNAAHRIAQSVRWGLVPDWSREDNAERRIFNARAETIHEKVAFRDLLRTRRCIVPASGFFEWTTQEISSGEFERAPLYIHAKNDELFGLAALWDEWILPSGHAFASCAIVTTESNRLLSPYHARMPAILRRDDYAAWLEPRNQNLEALRALLQPFEAKQMALRFLEPNALRLPANDARRIEAAAEHAAEIEYSKATSAPKKRLVLRDWVSPDGQIFFETRSFSRDDYTFWHPVVDLASGHVWCDCPDFRFRHAMHEPATNTPQHWCKHVARAVKNCRRHGELAR